MMLKMVIIGPAGSGKGTMSDLIEDNYPAKHISSGSMFREEIRKNTPLGQKANSYISQGKLVPDDVTVALVKSRISQDDCKDGYLLDGFPRSLVQAKAIEDLGINVVINLIIEEHLLVDRIVYRRLCEDCKAIYNIKLNPLEDEEHCERCGGKLYQRSDDTYEKLMVRLESYAEETQPVVDYYRKKGIVYDVDAGQSVEDVYKQIDVILTKIMEEKSN
ncbi:MAG TPA: nucleoside monophosphate kinase [Erysipelotrichaceae bacterium]|jgi:adenylate kinase|nr:nucleoside monophosphate kinase [Erysipelotrichaceae bacterium]HQA84929.1 nucleoside monophosphate kinase [Erysipelotrichaceae bacterium]